jgi:CRISPR system Cascade subunit CasE
VFLSKLAPDLRHGHVRRDLANPYDLHRTLLRAFPAAAEGGPGRVLFRVELPRTGAPFILVQSDKEPKWAALHTGYCVAGHPKPVGDVAFAPGQRLLFRLRANPAKRAGKSAIDPRWVGKRVGLQREDDQAGWLVRKAAEGGFVVRRQDFRVIPEPKVTGWKGGHALHFQAVRFEGVLQVTDPDRFLETVRNGIGPAKGFGFGLLSLARAES